MIRPLVRRQQANPLPAADYEAKEDVEHAVHVAVALVTEQKPLITRQRSCSVLSSR